MCRILTTSVPSTTSKQCFEQPAASFLVCAFIFIEYKQKNSDLISLSFSYDLKFFKRVCAFSRLKIFSAIKLSTNLGTSASVAPAKSANDFA